MKSLDLTGLDSPDDDGDVQSINQWIDRWRQSIAHNDNDNDNDNNNVGGRTSALQISRAAAPTAPNPSPVIN